MCSTQKNYKLLSVFHRNQSSTEAVQPIWPSTSPIINVHGWWRTSEHSSNITQFLKSPGYGGGFSGTNRYSFVQSREFGWSDGESHLLAWFVMDTHTQFFLRIIVSYINTSFLTAWHTYRNQLKGNWWTCWYLWTINKKGCIFHLLLSSCLYHVCYVCFYIYYSWNDVFTTAFLLQYSSNLQIKCKCV